MTINTHVKQADKSKHYMYAAKTLSQDLSLDDEHSIAVVPSYHVFRFHDKPAFRKHGQLFPVFIKSGHHLMCNIKGGMRVTVFARGKTLYVKPSSKTDKEFQITTLNDWLNCIFADAVVTGYTSKLHPAFHWFVAPL